nr:aryl-alcohol dehydrogenase [Cryptococcus depauperatus CBS 7841]
MSATLLQSSRDYTPEDANNERSVLDIYAPRKAKAELDRYRLLSPTAGGKLILRVSPLCLGAMSFGNQWTHYMGKALDLDETRKLLDTFYEAGGNFIDTANFYQDEQSEMIIGEWIEEKGIRDEIVLATKYTGCHLDRKEGKFAGIGINYGGNHKKSLYHNLERSLKKLRTTYIDLLYVHWWDYSTSIPEMMQSLNDVVRSGKVLYLGISDTPAWVVAQANEYARHHGLAQFVVYQGMYNLARRDMERDIIPMARAYGMSIAPWGVLGQGKFKDPEHLKKQENWRSEAPPSETDLKISRALKEVADEIGGNVSLSLPLLVALAWTRHKVADVFPIVGTNNVAHLQQNIEALNIHLTADQVAKLDKASEFDLGFPYIFFGTDPHYLPGGLSQGTPLEPAGEIQFKQLA